MVNDYKEYQFSLKANLRCLIEGTALVLFLGILFYRSLFGIILLAPIIYYYRRNKARRLNKERKWTLNLEFKDGIIAVAAALEAGYSAEHAFEEACRDLRQIYPEDSMIHREFSYIINQIRMNITVEKALNDFGERTGIEDILSFSEVFCTAKRTGGDLIHVIKIASSIISDKIEVKREILTLITAKRFEANIMKFTPILILVYLSISSPGFLDPMYHNFLGAVTMTIFLAFYLGAILLIDKIVEIEV